MTDLLWRWPPAPAVSTPRYIFFVTDPPAVSWTICLAQRKHTLGRTLSLLPIFSAQPSWAALATLLPSKFLKWEWASPCVSTCIPKRHGTHLRWTQERFPSYTSALMHWGRPVRFHSSVFNWGVTYQYLLLESLTQSLWLILLEGLSLGFEAELAPHQEEEERSFSLKMHNSPPSQRSVFLCRLGSDGSLDN